MENNLSFYDTFYSKIINDNLEENNTILIIIENFFNIIDIMSFIIKKYNLMIYIVIEDNEIFKKIKDNIKGEECEKNISVFLQLKDISNIIFNKIFIFHVYSILFFNNIISSLYNFSNKYTKLYIYCSLSNEKESKISFKNFIRESITNNIGYKMGYVIYFPTFINNLDKNKKFSIDSIKIYKKNNYLIYGNNIVYQIIMRLNV